MNDETIAEYIRDYLYSRLDSYEVNIDALGDDLADSLEARGYCSNPYTEFDRALLCPINKKRAKYCGITNCASHEFCSMLRKEGYM